METKDKLVYEQTHGYVTSNSKVKYDIERRKNEHAHNLYITPEIKPNLVKVNSNRI